MPSTVLGAESRGMKADVQILAPEELSFRWDEPVHGWNWNTVWGLLLWSITGDGKCQLVVTRKKEKEWWDSHPWRGNSKGEEMTGFGDEWNVRILDKVAAMTCFLASGIQWAARCLSIPKIPGGWSLKPGAVITAWFICLNSANWGYPGRFLLGPYHFIFSTPSDHLHLPLVSTSALKQLLS